MGHHLAAHAGECDGVFRGRGGVHARPGASLPGGVGRGRRHLEAVAAAQLDALFAIDEGVTFLLASLLSLGIIDYIE